MAPSFITLPEAEGTIQAGPDQQEHLDVFTQQLASGAFHGPATASIPVICKDGRFGGFHMLPNAAGGSETIFVADDLTDKHYAAANGSTLGGYENILNRLVEKGAPIGGHDDDQHDAGVSGCGANDKLDRIYDLIARKGNTLRDLAASLGIEVSDELHAKIVANALGRTDFSDGEHMLQALEAHENEIIVEHLGGVHQEVAAVLNTQEGTTLNRHAILDTFGEHYQSFNVDVWAFQHAAELLSDDTATQHELAVAMVYYNLATAHVLGGPALRIIVL